MNRVDQGVLILYNRPPAAAGNGAAHCSESVGGVLAEVDAVAHALETLRVPYRSVGVQRLEECPRLLARAAETVVVNLVEALAPAADDAVFVPALCRAFGKEFTGAGTVCLTLAQDKSLTKAVLAQAGLPVPAGVAIPPGVEVAAAALPPPPWIVKPAKADASEGICAETAVFDTVGAGLRAAVRAVHRDFGQAAIVEQFVGSRELNVALLENGSGVNVLPLAEIDFSAFRPDRPRVVDYAAKWLPDSFAYANTPRIIPAPLPAKTEAAIRGAALDAWHALNCRDYARVDVRLSADGRFHILEVNPNPDISPDAGFAAALAAAGIAPEQFVRQLLDNAAGRARAAAVAAAPALAATAGRVTTRFPGAAAANVETRLTAAADRPAILAAIEATAFFRPAEIEVAREVLDDALQAGPAGHYQSVTATLAGSLAGWICYGRTPCTEGTFDLYWLVVDPRFQRRGVGRVLTDVAEAGIAAMGGALAIVETSGTARYESTCAFYESLGYVRAAMIPDFYAPGDDKIVYTKRVPAPAVARTNPDGDS